MIVYLHFGSFNANVLYVYIPYETFINMDTQKFGGIEKRNSLVINCYHFIVYVNSFFVGVKKTFYLLFFY